MRSLKIQNTSLIIAHPSNPVARTGASGAVASVREDLDETSTVLRLGLAGLLQRTLRSTNSIENLNGVADRYTPNVKRWRGGRMSQRLVASAPLEAEQRFRRAAGYRDMRHRVAALDALAPPDVGVEQTAQRRLVNSRHGGRHQRNRRPAGHPPGCGPSENVIEALRPRPLLCVRRPGSRMQ